MKYKFTVYANKTIQSATSDWRNQIHSDIDRLCDIFNLRLIEFSFTSNDELYIQTQPIETSPFWDADYPYAYLTLLGKVDANHNLWLCEDTIGYSQDYEKLDTFITHQKQSFFDMGWQYIDGKWQ